MRYLKDVTGGTCKKISVRYQIGQQNGKMPFDINKCQILQVASIHLKHNYEMCGVKNKSAHTMKDLSVTIASNHKFSQQCNKSVKKANRVIGTGENLHSWLQRGSEKSCFWWMIRREREIMALRLKCRQVHSDCTKFFFTNAVVRDWSRFITIRYQRCSGSPLYLFFFFFYIAGNSSKAHTKKARYSLLLWKSKGSVRKGKTNSRGEMSWHSPLEGIQVVGRRKYRYREIVSEFTSKRDEGVKMLVNSSIRDLDSKGMSLSAKAGVSRPQERGEACS